MLVVALGHWEMMRVVRPRVHVTAPVLDEEDVVRERDRVFTPLEDREGIACTDLEERLQKVMDEYAGGISVQYGSSEGQLRIAELHLARISEELGSMCAADAHELMLCHEVVDRVVVARALVAHMLHRRETRWHAYQERLDFPERDDARWMVFVNSVLDESGAVKIVERPVVRAEIQVVLPPLADGAVIRSG